MTTSNILSQLGSAGVSTGFKNRLINGQFQIAQRGTSGSSSSSGLPTTATYPSVDRWFAYSSGAAVTIAQVAGSGNIKNLVQATGAGSVTAVGIGQRIESSNCYDLAGQTVTLSAQIANSLLTTVTWTAYYAATTDTWTAAATTITSGTFTVTSTLTQYSASFAVPSAATTGLQIVFSVGAQTSGTFQIGNAQLEVGTTATNFEVRDYGRELALCQRYYWQLDTNTHPSSLFNGDFSTGNAAISIFTNPVYMRTGPTVVMPANNTFTFNPASVTATTITGYSAGNQGGRLVWNTSGSPTAGNAYHIDTTGTASTYLTFSAEL